MQEGQEKWEEGKTWPVPALEQQQSPARVPAPSLTAPKLCPRHFLLFYFHFVHHHQKKARRNGVLPFHRRGNRGLNTGHCQGHKGIALECHPGRGIFFHQKKELETKTAGTGVGFPFCDQDRQRLPTEQLAGEGRAVGQSLVSYRGSISKFPSPPQLQVPLLLRLIR